MVVTHLRIRTQAATSEYARSVPIDIISTRALRSKRNAITARTEKGEIQKLCETGILRVYILKSASTVHIQCFYLVVLVTIIQ